MAPRANDRWLARVGGRLGLLAAALVALSISPTLATAQGAPALTPSVRVATSGDDSERVKTVPITKRAKGGRRVAMSIGPEALGEVRGGDRIEAGGEIEVSVTCLEPMPKCVGKIYHFTPKVSARLVLASGDQPGDPAIALSKPKRIRCSQRLPNRNHHCMIVIPDAALDVPTGDLPCQSGGCHLNLLLGAHHRKAKRGHRLVVGVDGDSQIEQDKGRIHAAVYRGGLLELAGSGILGERTGERMRKRLAVGARGSGGKDTRAVVYSLPLHGLRSGEQFLVRARMVGRIGHLPYNALVHSELILSTQPDSLTRKGLSRKVAGLGTQVTEKNGFNCTRGRSAHPDPCVVKKTGVLRITNDAARNSTLYVNLVVGSAAVYGGRHRSGDAMRIPDRGFIAAKRHQSRYRR